MLCQNCNQNEATVRYSENINGEKRELMLCEKCSKELGIENMDFNIPINFSSFLGDFFEDYSNETLGLFPEFENVKELKCKNCNTTYDEFLDSGKFGCSNCYDVFSSRIDPILKNIHGANMHVGRRGKLLSTNKIDEQKVENKENKKEVKEDKKDILKKQLEEAIKEERYEDAAKLRDEINKL